MPILATDAAAIALTALAATFALAYLGVAIHARHIRRSAAFRSRLIASCAHHLPGHTRDSQNGFTYRIDPVTETLRRVN